MASSSESTKLEHEGAFIEYAGSGKLKDKKVLVTGGEYVSSWIDFIILLAHDIPARGLVDLLRY